MADFVTDYLAGEPRASAFFPEPQCLPATLRPATPLDPAFFTALKDYQQDLGLVRSFEGTEHFIVTGQQPGLLTGPLYTIYKAITAIQLAQATGEATGQPCLPLFWLGADDHDFEEMRDAHLLTRQHQLQTLRYMPQQEVLRLPMFRVPLEPSLHRLLDEAAQAAPGSEFTDDVRDFLHTSLDASDNFAQWTARILARLFRDTPLLLFTPEIPAARSLAAPVIARELDAPLDTTAHVNAAAAALRASGYEVQLEKSPEECSFFLFEAGRRCKVVYQDGGFLLPESGARYSAAGLQQRLAGAPGDFSPNVALRCLVQQALFRPLAYVAGPGEIAYWAQFHAAFVQHGLPMPVVYPRLKALLTSLKLNKLRANNGLELRQLQAGPEEALKRAMLQRGQSPLLSVLRDHKQRCIGAAEQLAEAVARERSSASLRAMAASFHEQTRHSLERLELAAAHDDDAQVQAVRLQVQRLCTALVPVRKPQERVYSIFSFLFQHGWDLVPRLLQALDHTRHEVQEVEL